VTPLDPLRDGIWLKREDEHQLGAFKWRGAAGGPRGRGAVIARRGRDDRLVAAASEVFHDRERASPLEHSELVGVLPFQPDVLAPRELTEGVRRALEGCRQLHRHDASGFRA
jgi:hypothetical protein